jgi:hypothetical protein
MNRHVEVESRLVHVTSRPACALILILASNGGQRRIWLTEAILQQCIQFIKFITELLQSSERDEMTTGCPNPVSDAAPRIFANDETYPSIPRPPQPLRGVRLSETVSSASAVNLKTTKDIAVYPMNIHARQYVQRCFMRFRGRTPSLLSTSGGRACNPL